jgi:hypothetical protein
MQNKNIFFVILLLTVLLVMPQISAAHWIVGYIEDALDTTSPNGRTVSILKTSDSNEIFGIVGPFGMSGTSNIYMVDCELMSTPCIVGDVLNITLVDDFTFHVSQDTIQVTVSGAGFDMAANMSMTSPFIITGTLVDDAFSSPANEIDLTPNSTTTVNCTGVIETFSDIDSISNINSTFYASSSSIAAPDDNNYHYTNNSCYLNKTYGTSKEGEFTCSFEVEYYASPQNWNCFLNITDNVSITMTSTDATSINTLLSIGVNSSINFTKVDSTKLSSEKTIQIINFGNVKINLSLSGYGQTLGDNESMICFQSNISIENMKYNVAVSTPGAMNLSEAELYYTNLSSSPVVEPYELDARQNDLINDAINETYWRVEVPRDARESCQGNIIVGATQI